MECSFVFNNTQAIDYMSPSVDTLAYADSHRSSTLYVMSNLVSLGTPLHRCLDKSILALMNNVDEEKKVKVGASRANLLTELYKNINRYRDHLRLNANRLLPDGTPRFRSCTPG